MSSNNNKETYIQNSYHKSKPRTDGELYLRPEPNPFSQDWNNGYDDGLNGWASTPLGTLVERQRYLDGYATGREEKEQLNANGSSNT